MKKQIRRTTLKGFADSAYPLLHFTARRGWINDPNGLLAYTSPVTGETVFHLFYQHNPNDVVWGPMHWGHAVSDDLICWKELPIALYPDRHGTMFSGSAIVDTENLTGLKQGKEDVILLYYTCAGYADEHNTSLFTQRLACSVDGGITFQKYGMNPLIPQIVAENRDPKVIFCEELNQYVLALYFDGSRYGLFVSDDLLYWEGLQELTLDGDGECPDIYPLSVDDDPKERRWIFSGASGRYLVCEIRNGKFEPIQTTKRLCYGQKHFYAAQTFSGMPDGRRIGFGWERELPFDGAPFCGQMSLPLEFFLRRRGAEYFLHVQPIPEISSLAAESKIIRLPEFGKGQPLTIPLEASAYRIRIDTERDVPDFTLTLFGQEIRINCRENEVKIGENVSPLKREGERIGILLFSDKYSAEVFSCDGEALLVAPLRCDFSSPMLTLQSDLDVRLDELEITRLSRVVRR